jgi:hypothetical protein
MKNYGTQQTNDRKLAWNSDSHLDTSVALDELEKALKLTKK